MAFVDLFVGPVSTDEKDAYRAYAEKMGALTLQAGALSVSAFWGADIPAGMVLPLAAAVTVAPGETLVARMVRWQSRKARDAGWAEMMKIAASLPEPIDVPFDRSRVRHAGFDVLS